MARVGISRIAFVRANFSRPFTRTSRTKPIPARIPIDRNQCMPYSGWRAPRMASSVHEA